MLYVICILMELHLTGLHFSASHFLLGHPKCGRLHGHNYKVDVHLEPTETTIKNGMIIDFAQLRIIVNRIIEVWDHKLLVPTTNKNIEVVQADGNMRIVLHDKDVEKTERIVIPERHCSLLNVTDTTCEKMTDALAQAISDALPGLLVRVTLWETENSGVSSDVYSRDR